MDRLLRLEFGLWLVPLMKQPLKTHFLFSGNVKKLGETYPKISNSQNAELRLRWGQIVIKNDHQEDFWKVKEFLQSQVGEPHLLVPLKARGGPLSLIGSSPAGRASLSALLWSRGGREGGRERTSGGP